MSAVEVNPIQALEAWNAIDVEHVHGDKKNETVQAQIASLRWADSHLPVERFSQIVLIGEEASSIPDSAILDAIHRLPKIIRILEADRDQRDIPSSTEFAFASIPTDGPSLLIFGNLLESTREPRVLLRELRRFLIASTSSRAIFAARVATTWANPAKCESTLGNVNWYSRYSAQQLSSKLNLAGFCVLESSSSECLDFDDFKFLEVSGNREVHDQALAALGLPGNVRRIVVTTEYSVFRESGGIGTYVVMSTSAHPDTLVLFVGAVGLNADWRQQCAQAGIVHVAQVASQTNIEDVDPDRVWEAVERLFYIYHDLELIEFQDYVGIGFRIAQARRSGLLGDRVRVACHAHGNHAYLDLGSSDFDQYRDPAIDVRERLSIELADEAVFASDFMRSFYTEELGFRPRSSTLLRYPYRTPLSSTESRVPKNVDTVIFYGRATPHKGWIEFQESLRNLLESQELPGLCRVLLLGVEVVPDWLAEFKNIYVLHGRYPYSDVIDILSVNRDRSIVVLPYKSDNQPVSILEVLSLGLPFVAFRCGGIPEMLPSSLKDIALCDPKASLLAAAVKRLWTLDPQRRVDIFEEGSAEAALMWSKSAYRHDCWLQSAPPIEIDMPGEDVTKVTAVVTTYNGSEPYLRTAFESLTAASAHLSTVVVVDDSSDADSFDVLQDCCRKYLEIDYRIIRNEVNLGLAAARNVGLRSVDTAYVTFQDNDNALDSRFLILGVEALRRNSNLAAVTCWTTYFTDEDTCWRVLKPDGYRPLGSDVGLGLKWNQFGDAGAVYRVSDLKQIGGWSANSRAMWEDWQLFLRLALRDKEIWVIPKSLLWYRVRVDSMFRTYSRFQGWLRIADTLESVPRNHRVGVVRAVSHVNREGDLYGSLRVLRMLLARQPWKWLTHRRRIRESIRVLRVREAVRILVVGR